MKDVFIPTPNYQRFEELIRELLSSSVGLEMAAVLGSTGRGKTTAAERTAVQNPQTVYVCYDEQMSPVGLVREIAFRMTGMRPRSTQDCLDLIQEGLGRMRRIIMVDEADLMTMKHLSTMRSIHDKYKTPVVLIGLERLRAKLYRDGRLISRTRAEITFEEVNLVDTLAYYKEALGLTIPKELAVKLLRKARGDFRWIAWAAVQIERIMESSGLKDINDQVVNEVIRIWPDTRQK